MHHRWENELPDLGSTLYHPSDVDGSLETTHCRNDTMYLDVVRPKDVPRGRAQVTKDYSQPFVSADIDGASPRKLTWPRYGGSVDGDIPGTQSTPLYPLVNRQTDLSLTTNDIERARPQSRTFKTARVVNPLTPRYDLPSARVMEYEIPKPSVHEGEVRDTLGFKGEQARRIPLALPRRAETTISTHERTLRPQGLTPRDKMWTMEQAGSRILSAKFTPRGGQAAPITVERHPLDPVYADAADSKTTHPLYQNASTETCHGRQGCVSFKLSGPIEGAQSRLLHRDNGEPQNSLIRRDIAGTVPQRRKGATYFNLYDSPEITPHAKGLGLDCSDIPGAQSGTRKPGTL
jgi:hypothetical protein